MKATKYPYTAHLVVTFLIICPNFTQAGDIVQNLSVDRGATAAAYLNAEAVKSRRAYIQAKLQISQARDDLSAVRAEMCDALDILDRVSEQLGGGADAQISADFCN